MSFRSLAPADASPGEFSGFASASERDQAQALIDQCAQFKGVGDALAGRKAQAAQAAQIELSPGLVVFPKSSLRDLPAGAAGRLGLALMGASAAFSKAAKDPAPVSPRPAAPAKPAGGNSAWLDEDPGVEPSPAARPAAPKAPKRFAEEGEGEDSFGFLVQKLEREGFGGTSTAQVKANLARAEERLAKRKM